MRARIWSLLFAFVVFGCAANDVASSAPPASVPSEGGSTETGEEGGQPGDPDGGAGEDAPLSPIGPAGDFSKKLTVDGVARSYQLYAPASATAAMENGNVPILVGLHGAGDTGNNFITATLLKSTADKNGFVLLGPNAYDGGGGGAWDLHDNEGWPGANNTTNSLANDVSFVLRILADTSAAYRIDPKREFVCGFSRGAGFTGGWAILSNNAQLAQVAKISAGSPFAAYAVSAGFDMFGGQIDPAQSSPKRPVWIMHGTSDQAVPLSMGQKLSQSLQAAAWPVTFTPINGAPHGWMWRTQYGHTNQELWDWFMKNPLP
jgi:poly(3-hydroxybutyrate) depolymerase